MWGSILSTQVSELYVFIRRWVELKLRVVYFLIIVLYKGVWPNKETCRLGLQGRSCTPSLNMEAVGFSQTCSFHIHETLSEPGIS